MRRGFTMLELVLVVVIIGMVAAVAAPRLAASQTGARLNAAEKRLASEFAAAAEMATTKGVTHTIQFDIAASELRVFEGPLANKSALVRTVPLGAEPYGVSLVSTNITGGASTIRVDGFGMYSATAKVQIAHRGAVRVVNLNGPVRGVLVEASASEGGLISALLKGLLGGLTIHAWGGAP